LQMTSDGVVPDSTTKSNAQGVFAANWRTSPDTTVTTISGNSTPCKGGTIVCKSGTTVYANVTVSGTFTPSFLKLFSLFGVTQLTSINLAATSNAADNIPAYMNFYLLLDNTPSMGIAATTSGINTMVSNTSDQCAFACHDTSDSNNYYNLAKKLGVATRISNVAAAAANLLSTAQNVEKTNGIANEFSAAVYDFGVSATDPTQSSYAGYNQVYALSSNLSAAATAAAGIDLMTVNGQGQYNDEDTNLEAPLNAAQYLPAPGNGSSASTAKAVLFIVTDGMDDEYNCARSDSTSCRFIQPMNTAAYYPSPNACDKIKARGMQIAVLYTTQYPLPTNSFYNTYVAPYNAGSPTAIETALQNCATPGFFTEVNSDQDINAAMQKLFQTVIASVRITS
jgi:hypothetical protein